MTMGMNVQPVISVLIPAYNKERHIMRAIRSISAQSRTDLEVVVADDASTDRTAEIVREMAAADPRIRLVVHGENQGTLRARLNAFKVSSGKYVLCLDADDTLDPECAETLFLLAEKEKADITGFGARLLLNGKTTGTIDAVRHTLTGRNIFETAFCGHLYNWSVCLKLIRRDLFERAAAETEPIRCVSAEDFYFYTVLSFFAQRLVFSGKIFYNYHISEGLTGAGPESFRRYASMLDALQAVRRFLVRQEIAEKYASAFTEREREHFRLLLERFPGNAESLAFLTGKYDPQTVRNYLAEFFSPEYAQAAFDALERKTGFPSAQTTRPVGEKTPLRVLSDFLLPPESWGWFLVKRSVDWYRWRKYT